MILILNPIDEKTKYEPEHKDFQTYEEPEEQDDSPRPSGTPLTRGRRVPEAGPSCYSVSAATEGLCSPAPRPGGHQEETRRRTGGDQEEDTRRRPGGEQEETRRTPGGHQEGNLEETRRGTRRTPGGDQGERTWRRTRRRPGGDQEELLRPLCSQCAALG